MNKFPIFRGTRRFITMFTRARLFYVRSKTNPFYSHSSSSILILILSLHARLGITLHYFHYTTDLINGVFAIFFPSATTCPLWTSWSPMRCSYVVPMRWMVIHEYEVPGGALNLSSTKLPRPRSPWESSPSSKNPHGRTRNQSRHLMISSQKLWPLDHEAGRVCNIVGAWVEMLPSNYVNCYLTPAEVLWIFPVFQCLCFSLEITISQSCEGV
jgi:hypothetical protein